MDMNRLNAVMEHGIPAKLMGFIVAIIAIIAITCCLMSVLIRLRSVCKKNSLTKLKKMLTLFVCLVPPTAIICFSTLLSHFLNTLASDLTPEKAAYVHRIASMTSLGIVLALGLFVIQLLGAMFSLQKKVFK